MERKKDRGTESEAFYVYWEILKDFQEIDDSNEDVCIFVRERFLGVAKSVFSLEKPSYIFLLTGYMPTLHPLLPELCEFIFSQRAPASVLLRTDGSEDACSFEELSDICPKYALEIEILCNPADHDEGHVEEILSLLFSRKQRASVTLLLDGDNEELARDWGKKLALLRKTVPFSFSLAKTVDGSIVRQTPKNFRDVFDAFNESASAGPVCLPSLAFDHCESGASDDRGEEAKYCCVGANLVCIAADGKFSPAMGIPSKKTPCWEADESVLSRMIRIVACGESLFLGGPNRVLPTFARRDAAHAWMQELLDSLKERESQQQSPALVCEEFLLSRMKHLSPRGAKKKSIEANPSLLRAHMAEAGRLYGFLDAESRTILVSVLQSLETGDARYLPAVSDISIPPFKEGEVVLASGELADAPQTVQVHLLSALLSEETQTIDSYLASHDVICSRLVLSLDTEFAVLTGARETLHDFGPLLQCTTSQLSHALTVPLWLAEHCPDYAICLRFGVRQMLHIIATPKQPPARILPEPSFPRPLFSVLVLVDGDLRHEEILDRCLDSILTQDCPDVEILLLSTDSFDAQKTIARRASADSRRIRVCILEGGERADALNAGLDMALGSYLTVLDPHSMLSWGVLDRARDVINTEKPDILTFDQVFFEKESYERGGMTAGMWSGVESLSSFFAAGSPSCQGRFYRVERLRALRLRFAPFGSETECAFNIHAHLKSLKTIVCDDVACFEEKTRADEDSGSVSSLKYFGGFLAWYADLSRTYALDDCPGSTDFLQSLYRQRRSSLIGSMAESEDVSDDLLIALASCTPVLSSLLRDYAFIICGEKSLPSLSDESEEESDQDSLPYGNADVDTSDIPLLSVLLASSGPVSQETIESILSQEGPTFECVVVDDGASEDGFSLLQDFADINPSVRLYSRKGASHIALRNTLLEKARGTYVLFVAMGDICEPGFFAKACSLMEENEASIVCVSSTSIDEAGNQTAREYPDRRYDEAKVTEFTNRKTPDFCGTLFERSLLDLACISSGQEIEPIFCLAAFEKAFCIVSSSSRGYRHSFHHLDETIHADEVQRLARSFKTLGAGPFTAAEKGRIERFFTGIAAFWQCRQSLPLTEHEYESLRNPGFLRTLVRELGQEMAGKELSLQVSHPSFEIGTSFEPYIALMHPDCMPTDRERAEIQKNHRLLANFFSAYAMLYCDKVYGRETPSLDEISLTPVQEPATYLIPHGHMENDDNDILLSIVIPCRNSAETLNRCLESILKQKTFPLEVLLVDDRSDADATSGMALVSQANDPRIRLLGTPWTSGQGQVRNLAVQEARGRWILFLEPSDWLCSGFQGVLPLLEKSTADIIDCSWQAYSEKNGQVLSETLLQPQVKSGSGAEFRNWLRLGSHGLWSKIFRRDFFMKENLTFLPHRKSDDFLFLVQCYTKASSVETSERKAVSHVVDSFGIEERVSVSDVMQAIESIHVMHSYLLGQGFTEESEEYRKIFSSYADGRKTILLLKYLYIGKKIGLDTCALIKELSFSSVYLKKSIYNFKKFLRQETNEE